jgi:hypothetical protein
MQRRRTLFVLAVLCVGFFNGCASIDDLTDPVANASTPVAPASPAPRLLLEPHATTIVPGATLLLSPRFENWVGSNQDIEFTWESTEPAVATVGRLYPSLGRFGVVTGVSGGVTTIRVTAAGLSDSMTVMVLPPLTGSKSSLVVRSFRVIEFQYPNDPWQNWNYAPLIQVAETEGLSNVDVLKFAVDIPGFGATPSFCASIRLAPSQTLDLFTESYGEYQAFFSSSRRATGTEVVGRLTVRDGPEDRVIEMKGLIEPGSPFLPYGSGRGPFWRGCPR